MRLSKLVQIRKKGMLIAAAALTACALAACGGSGSSSDTKGGENTSKETSASETGGTQKDTLIVAKDEDVTSLDPQAIVNQKSFSVYCNLYEGLVTYDAETKEISPCLATEWEAIDDKTYHFKLREGVKFHDGNVMTSEDVCFSFERAMSSGVVSTYFNYLDSIEPDGDNAVIMHLKMPYAQLYQALSNPSAVVVSKKAVEQYGDDFAKNPSGTGAYKLKEWKQADSITLEAFEDYWGEKPVTPTVVYKVIPEGSQRTIMLENGEADIAYAVLPNDAGRIEDSADLTMIHEPGYKCMLFYLKTDSKTSPVKDSKVRQAIQYAVNKQEIADTVAYGYGQVGSLYCTPLTTGYNAEKDQGDMYDVDKSKALLAEAGYADGFDLDFYCQTGQTYEEVATILQAQLADVGINLNVITMESNTINEKVYSGEEIPIRMGFYNNLCGDVDLVMQKLLPSAYGQVYFNDEVEELMNEARSKTDAAERQKVYDKFWDLMAEDVPWITIYYEETMIGRSNKVDGFKLNPVGAHQLKTVAVYE